MSKRYTNWSGGRGPNFYRWNGEIALVCLDELLKKRLRFWLIWWNLWLGRTPCAAGMVQPLAGAKQVVTHQVWGENPKWKSQDFSSAKRRPTPKKVGDCISNNAIKGCRWFLTPGSLPQLLGSHSITVCLTAQRINIEKLHHSYIDYESGEKPRGESISSLQTFIAGTKIFGGSICRILPQRFQPLHVPSICGCFSNSFGWRFCQPSWGISLVSPQEKSHRILRIPSMDWYIIMIGLKNICPRKRHSNHSTPIYWYVESG